MGTRHPHCSRAVHPHAEVLRQCGEKPGIEAVFNHVRVTPNVYTTTQELDRLVEVIAAI